MIDPTMQSQRLPAPLINKDFVHGEVDCNYEIYLLELINASSWFAENHPGVFIKPISESSGECDANNDDYHIDFKLLISTTSMQASSLLSRQQYKVMDGVVLTGVSKEQGEMQATRLHAAFRGRTILELNEIRNGRSKKRGLENDICSVLKVLETKKNLLLFFPYKFSFVEPHEFDLAIKSISDGLFNDFHVAMQYKDEFAADFDTFLVCVYEKYFLIFYYNKESFQLCDRVKTSETSSFCKLLSYVDFGEYL